jgi:hypothetical protein
MEKIPLQDQPQTPGRWDLAFTAVTLKELAVVPSSMPELLLEE